MVVEGVETLCREDSRPTLTANGRSKMVYVSPSYLIGSH